MLKTILTVFFLTVRDIWAPPFGRWDVWAPDVWALCCISAVSISLSHVVIVFHIN